MAEARANATRQVNAAEAAMGRKLTTAGKKLSSVGASMTRHLTLPAVAVSGASIKMAVDFNDSMERIRNLVGASQSQVDKWSSQLLKLGPRLGKSPQELADALYFVTSSGIKASDALDVVTISAKASALGLGETQTVADAVTSAMNAYAKSHLSAADATNTLAQAVKFGKGEPEDLAKSIGRVIPVASKLKVPFTDVGASLSALTLQGLDAAEATTSLRAIFLATLKPTTDSEKALKSVGLTAEDLRASLEDKGTLATLQMLSDKFKGNEEQIARIFPNVRALVGAFNLTGDSAKKNAEIFDEMSKKTNMVNVGFQRLQKTDAQTLRRSLAGLQAAGIEIGEKLLPVLVDLAGNIADVAGAFAGMPNFARDILLGAIVVGPLIRAAGAMLTIAGAVTKIAAGEGALAALGLAGGAAAAGPSIAGDFGRAGPAVAAGEAAGGGFLAGMAAKIRKIGIGRLGIGATIVQGIVGEVHRQSAAHSDEFQTAIAAMAEPGGGQDRNLAGKAFAAVLQKNILADTVSAITGLKPSLTDLEQKANDLKDALNLASVYKRITPERRKYLEQLGREIGLDREAQRGLKKYLDTVKDFPIGGGPHDWLKNLGDLQEAAATSSSKTRRALLSMAREALHSGQITLTQFGRLRTTIEGTSRGADSLSDDWRKAMSRLGPDARRAAKESSTPIETAIKGLRQRYGGLAAAGADMSKQQREAWKDLASAAVNQGNLTQNQADKLARALTNSGAKQEKALKRVARTTGESLGEVRKVVGNTTTTISKDYSGMVEVSIGGMTYLTSKTQAAAKAMGINKEINFHADPHSGSRGAGGFGHRNRQGGFHVIPGYGSGDKVPVHVGGELVALTEPGELLGVVNRSAARAVHNLNHRIPRDTPGLQSGGMIDPSWDPGTERLNAAISSTVGSWEKRYRTDMTAGYDPGGGHVSPGHNVTGTATDMVPGAGGSWDTLEAGLRAIVKQVPVIYYGPQWVPGTVALDNHGRGNHAHIEWGMNPKGIGGAELKRMVLSPAIAMSRPGQGALDMVHDAGQGYLNKLMQRLGGEGGGGYSIDGPVQSSFAKVARALSRSKTATLALGEAGYAESGMQDLAGGDGSSSGALQLLASTAASMGINPHDEGQVSSAFLTTGYAGRGGANKLADQGMAAHLVAQGVQGSAFSSGSNYADQLGPAQAWMHRYRLRGGGAININEFLGRYGKARHKPRRHKMLGRLTDRLKGIGLPDRVTDRIKKLDRDAAIYADLADRASALTGDSPVPAKVFGPGGMLDQAGWLTKELGSLWPLRNELIKANHAIEHKGDHIDKLLKRAKEAQRRLKKKMRAAERRIKHLRDKDKMTPEDRRTLDKLRRKGLSGDDQKRLAFLQHKQDKHHLTENEREQLRKLTRHHLSESERAQLRKLSKKDTLTGKERHELERLSNAQVPRHLRQQALDKIIPALHDQAGRLDGTAHSWRDRLEGVQGIGSPTRRFSHLDSPVDTRFGGELLDVQLALRDLAHPSGASDAGALDIAGLQEFAKLVRVGAFDTVPFMGAHARGGVALVGEAGAELLHMPTGTRVHSAEDTAELLQPEINASIYADFYVDGKPIRGMVRGEIRKVEVEGHQQLRADVVRGS